MKLISFWRISGLVSLLLAGCSTTQPLVDELPAPRVEQLPAPGVAVRFNDLEAPTLMPLTQELEAATAAVDALSLTLAAPVAPATATPLPPVTLSPQILAGYDVLPAPDELVSLAQQVFAGNLPAQIEIPAIDVFTHITPVGWRDTGSGIEWDSPQFAAGFLVSSIAPGTSGNTVVYGHNNIFGEVFRNLEQLTPGDGIFITTADGQTYVYSVEIVETFQEYGITTAQQQSHLAYFNPTSDSRLTLLTCWPYTGNSHRTAIVARPSG